MNSQVFDHTSVLRFLEKRFGVHEPNISAWRRTVCGDLTTAFDFADPNRGPFVDELPETTELAHRARGLPSRTTPETPRLPALPSQESGVRPSRALPYELHVQCRVTPDMPVVELTFANTGRAGAVFHVYDRLHLDRVPRRYTVEPSQRLVDSFHVDADQGAYDLWVLAPNGFHRHFTGNALSSVGTPLGGPEVYVRYDCFRGALVVRLRNPGARAQAFHLQSHAYLPVVSERILVAANRESERRYSLRESLDWYDFTVTVEQAAGFSRRFAGRLERAGDSFSDPAMAGEAMVER